LNLPTIFTNCVCQYNTIQTIYIILLQITNKLNIHKQTKILSNNLISHIVPFEIIWCYNDSTAKIIKWERIALLLKRTCSNCIRGTIIKVNSDVLCRDKGAVASDYCCSKHRFVPSSKIEMDNLLKCINCENFILNISTSKESCSFGLCQLFSVRQFDGKLKKACSKFVKRKTLEVS